MNTKSTSYLLSALQELSEEQWKKLFFAVQKQFGRQLRNIPGAPSAEDLVHEALEDLLEGRRSWPQDRVSLPHCLRNIVWSKVNHLTTKAVIAKHVYVLEEVIDWEVNEECAQEPEQRLLDGIEAVETLDEHTIAALRNRIFQDRGDDAALEQVITYMLDRINDDIPPGNRSEGVGGNYLGQAWDKARAIVWKHLKELNELKLQEHMLDCVKQDKELTEILKYCFSSYGTKARDIAAELKIPITHVYNANRRLKSNACLKRLYEQLSEGEYQ
ncbi:hypothetical protein CSB45_02395 [candidate division KSB3 bacterium]|uniref:Uncharacterized protein n=1 Tax=candidate division KSB3 bacterium TaxID=2044937 RepID=A0A2G6E9W0_9BACT|nr:MAG: hypothetical protein CSB45_02395 [candidate division KSB3 bacterium]PIE30930.1 MAG: hypothetical protein CSA57_01005 [candidate division KSB3 bacterium]